MKNHKIQIDMIFKDYNKISDELDELNRKIEEYEKLDRAEGAQLLESDPNYFDLVNIQLNSMRTYRQCLIARKNSITRHKDFIRNLPM